MGEITKIQWTHHTFNPWVGCTKVSDLCKNCYAEVNTFTRRQRANGRELWGPEAERHRTSEAKWREVWRWNADAIEAGERRRVFCASLADVFEDRRDLDPWRADLWRLIEETPGLDWLLLTKRPQNVRTLAPEAIIRKAWVGYSGADYRGVGWLLDLPAAVRFLSLEPLLAPADLTRIEAVAPQPPHGPGVYVDALRGHVIGPDDLLPNCIDWVIVGGESNGGRPCDVEWIRSIVAQCKAAGTPAFVKQLGSNVAHHGMPVDLRDRKGGDPQEWPADLRVRQFPEVARG